MRKISLFCNIILSFALIGMLFSCKNRDDNKKILKEVAADFIKVREVDMIRTIADEGINNMALRIFKIEYFQPPGEIPIQGDDIDYLIFNDLDTYTLCYSNNHSRFNMKISDLFYVNKYPVLVENNRFPSLEMKKIPNYLFENEIISTDEVSWMIVICNKNKKYIVVRDIFEKGYDYQIEQIKLFQKECTGD